MDGVHATITPNKNACNVVTDGFSKNAIFSCTTVTLAIGQLKDQALLVA